MPLQTVFPVEEFLESRLSYLSSGSFGSVMVHQRGRRRSRLQAVKVITCLPSGMAVQMTGSGMKYRDVYREAQCLLTLGSLASGVRRAVKVMDEKGETEDDDSNPFNTSIASSSSTTVQYKAGCFPQLYAIHLVDPTRALMSLEAFFACTPGVASYPVFEKALLLMEHCGSSLHGKLMEPAFVGEPAVSVAKQVILGLVTAEQAFRFEHRDLHVSNLMVASAGSRSVATFQIGETRYSVPTYGAQAKIIDFSYARLETADGETLYKNLDSLFEGEDGEEQGEENQGLPKKSKTNKDHFDGYRDMYIARGGGVEEGADRWEHYSPRSNLAWVKRFFSEMIQLMAYTVSEMTSAARSSSSSTDDWARLVARAEGARKYMASLLELATRSQTTEHFLEQMLSQQKQQGEEGNEQQQQVLVPITVKVSGAK